MTLDEREKIRNKPNFAQPTGNQWVTTGLQYAGRLAEQNLTDRSTAIRGDLNLRADAPEEQQQGHNELSEQRRGPCPAAVLVRGEGRESG